MLERLGKHLGVVRPLSVRTRALRTRNVAVQDSEPDSPRTPPSRSKLEPGVCPPAPRKLRPTKTWEVCLYHRRTRSHSVAFLSCMDLELAPKFDQITHFSTGHSCLRLPAKLALRMLRSPETSASWSCVAWPLLCSPKSATGLQALVSSASLVKQQPCSGRATYRKGILHEVSMAIW